MSNTHFKEQKKLRGFAKHSILEQYLKAWFPIHLNTKKHAVYVDGFAGPGKHSNGDDGSPLLVLKMLKSHNMTAEGNVDLIFIEKDKTKFAELQQNLTTANEMTPSKNKITINIHFKQGDFNEVMVDILSQFGEKPMLVFADPFGFNCKMSTLQLILQTHNQKANKELLINFMNGNVVRFLSDSNKKAAINELMGSFDWQIQQFEEGSEEKLKTLCKLYIDNLQEGYKLSPAKFNNEIKTLIFSIKGKNNAHVYHIVYATSHNKGIEVMKKAMNKCSQAYDDYSFSEWLEEKKEYRDFALEKELKIDEIVTKIKDHFAGQPNVSGAMLDEFIESTHHSSNVKKELKEELIPFITTPSSIKRFKEMKFNFSTSDRPQENVVNDNAEKTDVWKTRILRIVRHFAGKTVTGEEISAFFKETISSKLNNERILQKKLASYLTLEKGKKGFAKTEYSFPKRVMKISASPRGQPVITNYFKPKRSLAKKNLNFC